jgi:hypothetical protein
MAIGDTAAAAGLVVYPATQDARLGYENDNQRGDELATHMTAGTHHWTQITGKPVIVVSYVGQDIRLRTDAGLTRVLMYVDGTEFDLAPLSVVTALEARVAALEAAAGTTTEGA